MIACGFINYEEKFLNSKLKTLGTAIKLYRVQTTYKINNSLLNAWYLTKRDE